MCATGAVLIVIELQDFELSPSTFLLDVRVCARGHVVGSAAVKLQMTGKLGWRIEETGMWLDNCADNVVEDVSQ